MKKTVLLLATLVTLLPGCSKNVWPSDVKPGKTLLVTLVGENKPIGVKVIAVDGDWLRVELETVQGSIVLIPRERITFIGIIAKK